MGNKLNVYSFVGISKPKSRLIDFTTRLTKELGDYFEIEAAVETGITQSLESCRGCLTCFLRQTCPLDRKDDFSETKKRIEAADLVILASPVYLLNVSSDMKVFLDRLAYWAHLLKLRGKKAVVVASTSATGSRFVVDYLETVLNYMGCPVIKKIELFDEVDFSEEQLLTTVQEIAESLQSDCYSDKKTELIFQHMRKYMTVLPVETNEKKYWEENHMLNKKSLDELVREEQDNVCKI